MAKKATSKAPAKKEAGMDVQSGMDAGKPVAEKKAVTKAQFDEADQKGDPRFDEVAAGVAIRGY